MFVKYEFLFINIEQQQQPNNKRKKNTQLTGKTQSRQCIVYFQPCSKVNDTTVANVCICTENVVTNEDFKIIPNLPQR